MNERRLQVEARMAQAKADFSAAARAALNGDPNAPALADTAFRAVNAARTELEALNSAESERARKPA
jgi:hypothetical protein